MIQPTIIALIKTTSPIAFFCLCIIYLSQNIEEQIKHEVKTDKHNKC